MYEAIVGLLLKSIDLLYKWLSENFISSCYDFRQGIWCCRWYSYQLLLFLLITVYFIMKQAKRLPKRYVLETFDQDGKRTLIPELRVTFATYQAARQLCRILYKTL